jgi:small subunit ribosomal protein S2
MTEKNSKLVEEMFAVGAHYGYSKTKRHPTVKDLIYGTKNNQDIIDLEKTEAAIEAAKGRLKEIFSKGGRIIFVGNKAEIKDLTPELAKCDKISYVNNRWIGGTLTNFAEIKKRILKLKKMMEDSEKGEFAKFTKKEALKMEKEILKLQKYYFGLLELNKKPDAVVIVDSKDEAIAAEEAKKVGVDIISIVNTDTNIEGIKYPILANDRSRGAIEFIVKELFSECNKK